jgi:hypothetical protein
MISFSSKRILFVSCTALLALGSIAASPDGGGAAQEDDAGQTDDAGQSSTGAGLAPSGVGCPAPTSLLPSADDAGPMLDDGSLVTLDADILKMLSIDKPDSPEFDFTSVQAPYTAAADCNNFGTADGHLSARSCLCDKCFSLMQECDSMVGCQQIRTCEWQNAGLCGQPLTCYFATPCATVIDQWGNTSLQAFIATKLNTCAQNNGCPSQ